MARPLNDSPYLYGLHDPGGESIMAAPPGAEQKVFGWILFTEELGSDPNDTRGGDYSRWADQGLGILVRLNHGYEPKGTIPYSSRYADFARRCANFARNSRGCHIWIIGNEMNFPVERPGVLYDRSQDPPRLAQAGEVITPGLYANCYRQCRTAIRAVPGHEADQVITGAVAPWNPQTPYEGNPNGDWTRYQEDLLTILGPSNCDGISIHAYTHGADPKLVYTDAFMNSPFQNRQYNFRTYQDFMKAIPPSMRALPVYLTEADQNDAWRDENNGWVQRVYGEIDWWNRQTGTQVIRAVILYRWPKGLDKWGIEGKNGVIQDFRQAMTHQYSWEAALQAKTQPQPQPETPVQPQVEPTQPTPTPTPSVVDTSPIKFNETGQTASGAFVAFYRQYGLDLTGYPISAEYVHAASGLKTQDWQRLVMEEYPAGKIRLRLAGQELSELRHKVGRLEQQVARLMLAFKNAGATGPLEPEITDITQQLPRKPGEFIQRPADQIQFIVINHTAVRPAVGADRVAQAQLARWPGIVSQYFVTETGQIQQTNPMDEVVARDQNWIYNGVNIYVAGNFDETIPNDAQLDALAQLCAWLLYTYNLAEDALRGVSEFIVTRSPGLQWLTGQRWKDKLLERVRAAPAGPAQPSTPSPQTDTQTVAALRSQIEALQSQILDAQARLTDAEGRNALLQAQLDALMQGSGGAPGKLPQPTITDIAVQLPCNAASLKSRPTPADGGATIRYLVFNHTAVDPSVGVERVAAAHQSRWGAILYQYFITGDGAILQTNALDQIVDLNQPWVSQGINIAVAGNFTAQVPNDAQLQAAAQLSAWLMQEHAISIENVKGVSEFINSQSPGAQWLTGQKWKETLLARIAAVQASAPPTPTPTTPTDSIALAALRAHVSQLEAALRRAEASITALTQERDALRAQIGVGSGDTAQLNQQIQTLNGQMQALTAEKATLAQQIQTLTVDKTALTRQVQTLTANKTTLTQQVQALTADKTTLNGQLSAASQELATFKQKVQGLEATIKQYQTGGATPGTPATVPAPDITDIVDKLPVHATLKYDKRTLDKITHIAIHHSAAPANVTPERVAAYHVSKDWPGIGYHFYVEPDGKIYQTNRLETISYQVYQQNHYSIGICVSGEFSNGVTPTPLQIERTGHLVAWLMQKLNVPLANVWGHKEFPQNTTACPGNDWLTGKKWKETLITRIKGVQTGQMQMSTKSIGHYMLFWQRQNAWAKEDWGAAANYFARFRPTAGFSADDARNAEYVSIVGGVAGVPYETEQALIAAGCKVERLSGVDFADTKRMLDDLAQTGRRFKTFNV